MQECSGHQNRLSVLSGRFSTLVKGYCQYGDIDKGFAVLKQMTTAGKHEPDEILYNSLLDGCAKQHRVDEALALVEDMHKNHVRPSGQGAPRDLRGAWTA